MRQLAVRARERPHGIALDLDRHNPLPRGPKISQTACSWCFHNRIMNILLAPNYRPHFKNAEENRYCWGSIRTYPSEFNIFSVLTRHLGNESFNIGSIHNPIFQLLQLCNIETKDYNIQCCGLMSLNNQCEMSITRNALKDMTLDHVYQQSDALLEYYK